MDWFFDGIGTLLIGLIIGGSGGSAITWKVMSKRISQKQNSGNHAYQVQAGRNVRMKD
ncbi:hypothetical protein Csp1_15590 [Corynebacterium provencense]|uniref:Uncharacterized protein n=1 Tax=Corynebacterium provencense TaxID=1737425 RepID=A0A2Z3YUV2_9CORY|nr:hypothetical protein Csp1_15590 [Corynebacterium provencense]